MKQYPKIYHCDNSHLGNEIKAFLKYDGQNFRAEANFKRGFYKFGSRTQMVNEKDELFGEAIKIFMNKYSDGLMNVFSKKYGKDKFAKFTVFGEYFGENSFAGRHLETDKKDLILFDVNIYKKGFVLPQRLIDDFGHLGLPNLIYEGELTEEFIEDVKSNKFNLKEGVIAKGEDIAVKIKTRDWLNKVKTQLGEDFLAEDLDYNINIY